MYLPTWLAWDWPSRDSPRGRPGALRARHQTAGRDDQQPIVKRRREATARPRAQEWPSFAAYVISFATIGIIWINHHVMIRRLKTVDHTILMLNLVLLLSIGLLPFTTALMAAYLNQAHGQHLAAAIYSGSFLTST
jgi:hypothetical protein